jgi:hypothetical protein
MARYSLRSASKAQALMTDLPNELIYEILKHTLTSTTVFYPELCTDQDDDGAPETTNLGYKVVRYRKIRKVAKIKNLLPPNQYEHVRDWILINSTCRAFRAIGKPLFFQLKTFGMALRYFKQLTNNTRKVTFPFREGRPLALELISKVAIYNMLCFYKHTDYLALVDAVDRLPGVSECMLLWHSTEKFPMGPCFAKLEEIRVPKMLEELIQGCGLRSGVKLCAGVDDRQETGERNAEREVSNYGLQRFVYPHLQAVVKKLAEGAEQGDDKEGKGKDKDKEDGGTEGNLEGDVSTSEDI